jgi:hypothetical protein
MVGATVGELDLPLTLTVPCRASPRARSSPHPVVVETDWTVRTGHDEGLERIAVALGGGVSCLGLLRTTLPGFRTWWERAGRRAGPLIRSPDRGATWHCSDGVHGCCPGDGFADPHAAARHARGVAHVAAVTGAPRRQLQGMVTGLGDRADPSAPSAPDGKPPDPLTVAGWSCGLDPAWTERVRAQMAAGDCPGQGIEDVTVLLALAQSGADPGWVLGTARSTAAESEPGLLRWLAWTATQLDVANPAVRTAWLRTGARRDDIVALSEAGYLPSAVEEVAAGWGLSRPGAAQWLARWVELGYLPDPADLAALHDLGLGYPPQPPARSAVERVLAMVGGRRVVAARGARGVPYLTDLAVEFVRCGNAHDTAAAVRRREGLGSLPSGNRG